LIDERIEELTEELETSKQMNYKVRNQLVRIEKKIFGLENRIDELNKIKEVMKEDQAGDE
jgi:phage shock protein A